MTLKKTIPVEEDNLELAIEKAKDIFYDNELTPEYLDARDTRFFVNNSVVGLASGVSKIIVRELKDNLTEENVKKCFYDILALNDDKDLIYNEMLKILEKDYGISFEKISI